MSTSERFNPLDPFGENEGEFKTKEIRHSHSRDIKNWFVNVADPKDKKSKTKLTILIIVLLLIIIGSVVFIVLQIIGKEPDPTISDNPLINPTGREATSEYDANKLDDPELRATEEKKLTTVHVLLMQEDWEYANALFETIFPDYLDTCGKYDYYRAAVLLADNFEDFSIDRETASSRLEYLLPKCNPEQ